MLLPRFRPAHWSFLSICCLVVCAFLAGKSLIGPTVSHAGNIGSPNQAPAPIELSLATNDLIYDPVTQRIYASIPSNAGSNSNSLTQIDPFTATIGNSVFIGSEPKQLAISDNSQYIYVSLDGVASVRRFDIASQTAQLEFALGNSPFAGPYHVEDMEVVPGNPNVVAVARQTTMFGQRHEGVAIYNNGVALPNITTGYDVPGMIEFSAAATTLYGYGTSGSFFKMTVSLQDGVSNASISSNLFINGEADIRYDNGLIYSTTGRVVNPETSTVVGTCVGLGPNKLVLPDASANRIYFLTNRHPGDQVFTLKVFDKTTFIQTGSLTINGISGTPGSLIKWGADGLAFRTTGNQVFLLSTSMIVPIGTTSTPSPVQVANGVIKLPLVTNDLVYDPSSARIFASLPSAAGSFGNTLAPINPETGVMGNPGFIGSEPGKLAISDNNQYMYVGLNGSATVRKVDVMSQSPGLEFQLQQGTDSWAMWAEDIAVFPGNPNSIAVSRRNSAGSAGHQGVVIFDDGVPRSERTPSQRGSNVIEFSSSASTLYGYHNDSTHFGFSKMAVSSSGVSVVKDLSYLIAGFGVDIRYAGGSIYATSGRVINPETGRLEGTFPLLQQILPVSGPVVPDLGAGRVYFLIGFGSGAHTLEVYDANTFTQTGSLTISGLSSKATSLIKCGPNRLAFRTVDEVFFIDISAITPIPPAPLPTPVNVATGIKKLSLAANDLVYDPNTQKVYASIPSTAGSFGNSIASINPLTGAIDTPVFMGSEPNKLAISGDNQFIYVGLDGAAAIRRFDIASQTAVVRFPLSVGFGSGVDGGTIPLFAEDIAVMPGNPSTIAVSRRNHDFSPRHEGVALFDNGVVRSQTTPRHTGSNSIEFSSSNAILYGMNTESTEFGLRKMAVSPAGLTITSTVAFVVPDFGGNIKHDSGVLYASGGEGINAETGVILGKFFGGSSHAFVPESAVGRVYFVKGRGSTMTLKVFDLNTFQLVADVSIPGINGDPFSLIRWGTNGLAFRTNENEVVFIQTSLIPSPTPNEIGFSASSYTVNEADGRVNIVVNRAVSDTAATVGFTTSDQAGLSNCNMMSAIASSRCDYTTVLGTLHYAVGETSKTISIPVIDDGYAEGSENFTVSLSIPTGGRLGTPASATVTINDNEIGNGPNPIDQTAFFVQQHYLDFLNRQPDPAGYAGWQAVINNCPPGDITCDRIHVSSAFYRSPEFQERGYFIYRFYPVAFGRKPNYEEFIAAMAKVSGFLTNDQLEAAKVAFIEDFMSRRPFVLRYSEIDNLNYVDVLVSFAGVTLPNQQELVNALNAGTKTRAQVLREIVESPQVYNKYYNQAFVVMQYFGYLRRDPDALYLNWIAHLDSTGDYRSMINGFMNSPEYRFRFGP